MYGTLVRIDGVTQLRKGILEFLKKHKEKIKVVATDDPIRARVWSLLEDAGIKEYFRKVYYGKDLTDDDCKDLARITREFNVKNTEMVFIGDNLVGRDRRSCEKYKVKFIQVPTFDYDDEFDMMSIEI